MKTIGMIGGMSWESTVTYYQLINRRVNELLGGYHSAKILLYCVDFHELEDCLTQNNWSRITEILTEAASNLEKAGADFIIICTNTMHKVVPQIKSKINIPILHIAEAAAEALRERNITKAALLGTKYTMQQDFYREKLISAGIEVLIPEGGDIELVNSVIFEELCAGIVKESSKKEYLRIINGLADKGCQGVVLGCTEIGMLISQKDLKLPVFDTTLIHALKAADFALK
jgi:aspartate racemase